MLREERPLHRVAVKTLVVVNHDPEFLQLFRRVIEAEAYRTLRQRYQVVVVRGGDRTYEVIRDARPSAVVLDLPTGDLASWQILDRVTHDPQTAAIPVLACSDPTPGALAREAELRGLGCDLLLKPFSVDELLERVGRLTG